MSEKIEQPQRAFYVEMKVGGDTKEDLIGLIEEFLQCIKNGGDNCVTGGYGEGGYFELKQNSEMTHDKYVTLLEVFNAQSK